MPKPKASRGRSTSELFQLHQRSPAHSLMHALANALDAIRLRVRVLKADARCMDAQGDNIQALARIVEEAAEKHGQLDGELAKMPRTPRPKR